MLRIEGVSKHFGGVWALKDCFLDTKQWPVVGLIGPNGSGKTTLFHTITGFYKADRGKILFQEKEIQALPVHAIALRGIGRTFQLSRIFESLSLLDNLLISRKTVAGENILSLFFRGSRIRLDEKTAREKALAYLNLVGLSDKQDQKAGELSYGQRKLLELTRILMLDPGLILLDEPAAGINPTLISRLLSVIQKLKAQGKRFLIIEHNMDVVIRLCDWVYVLDAGTPIAEGPPEKIKKDPVVLEAYFGK